MSKYNHVKTNSFKILKIKQIQVTMWTIITLKLTMSEKTTPKKLFKMAMSKILLYEIYSVWNNVIKKNIG